MYLLVAEDIELNKVDKVLTVSDLIFKRGTIKKGKAGLTQTQFSSSKCQ